MLVVSESEMFARIGQGVPFEASLKDGSLTLKVEKFVPFVCAAIHNGHRLRKPLAEVCALTEEERLYEEDPHTGKMIQSLPITLIAHDSRYEYDLNRPPEDSVYQVAWGKSVWHQELSDQAKQASRTKHATFFRVLGKLLSHLERQFGAVLVFDVHSYNYCRIDRPTPVFNIGTAQLDGDRWGTVLKHTVKSLQKIALSNIDTTVEINDVFQGKGYLATFVRQHHPHTAAFPVEIKKVYMEEQTGEPFPLIVQELKQGLREAFVASATFFANKHLQPSHFSGKRVRCSDLLPEEPESLLKRVDAELFRLVHKVETLLYVNPINLANERRLFQSRGTCYNPQFRYRQLNLDPYEFREQLYRLPIEGIYDASLQLLYRQIIDAHATKIDLLTSLGSEQFLYNSLRYYGEPSQQDIDNAKFILYAPAIPAGQGPAPRMYPAKEVVEIFKQVVNDYGFSCKVELSNKIVARAMVNNLNRTVMVNRGAEFDEIELNALIHHEIGVHMVTTINARQQPLKLLRLGLPENTYTQEGMALLAEYLSGCLTLSRLQVLALRVIAVASMLKHYDFHRTFTELVDDYGMNQEEAFALTVRVYRGGGFTKDFLYLRGFKKALLLFREVGVSEMRSLLIGKTGFEFLPLLNELIDRKILSPPGYWPKAFEMEPDNHAELEFVLRGIR